MHPHMHIADLFISSCNTEIHIMTKTLGMQQWIWIHKWSSLVCTLFLLVICITGLPLIFSDEINDWVQGDLPYAVVGADAPRANLDSIVSVSQKNYPGQIVTGLYVDDEEPKVNVYMAPSFKEAAEHPQSIQTIFYDAHTGQVLKAPDPADLGLSFMDVMLTLHRDMFAGLAGELFFGLMGLLFVIAIVSGVVLYSPFMKKLDFGTVRQNKSTRLKWLDLHNLLGIVTLAWLLVVGATGVLNELSTPLFGLWQMNDVRPVLQPWQGKTPPAISALSSAQEAFDKANTYKEGMHATSVVFPGSVYGSPHHYVIWTKGSTTLTSRLFSPALVDASTGELITVATMPWYLKALEVSRPLHFGDYGGMPMKILWALFDIITIIVLASGLYLWIARRQKKASNQHPAHRTSESHS